MVRAKTCAECGKPLKGRSDKRFCDGYCRSSYNNKIRDKSRDSVHTVNSILRRNRKILQNILEKAGKPIFKVSAQRLIQLGFQFNYITHIYTTNENKKYFFCYDYGYLPLENGIYLIVKERNSRFS